MPRAPRAHPTSRDVLAPKREDRKKEDKRKNNTLECHHLLSTDGDKLTWRSEQLLVVVPTSKVLQLMIVMSSLWSHMLECFLHTVVQHDTSMLRMNIYFHFLHLRYSLAGHACFCLNQPFETLLSGTSQGRGQGYPGAWVPDVPRISMGGVLGSH